MKFGYKSLIAAGLIAASTGFGLSAASAMPMAGIAAPVADTSIHADKAAVVCIGRCYRRFGYYRPYLRPYRAYAPLGFYHRPYFGRFGYHR